jgi:quercetin dioxygenase-like cupin family protein
MTKLPAGVTKASEGFNGVVWNILGQTYTLKEESDSSMGWHALLPPGSFVPPHIHPTQDEFIYMIEGKLDLELGDQKSSAAAGDLIRLPMNEPHGLFNNGTAPVRCLFDKLHNLTDPAEVVRISAQHDVNFLPPKA